jgi:signal transduction histidine kinase
VLGVQSLVRVKDGLPERALKRAALIERQVHQLTRLIERLLDISRIAAGKLSLELETVDLAALTNEAVGRLTEDLKRARCALSLRAAEPVRGRWDAMRLDQIVTNLVSNALKYGPGEPIEVIVSADETMARLTVRDHGIGIAPADQERVFRRFERAASRGYGGLGLGLWIVHEIVMALGGLVRIESALGQGATFVVELPRGQPLGVGTRAEAAGDGDPAEHVEH